MNKISCTTNDPGIVNIEYVKDILTESVVTRNFTCSKFGPYTHPILPGWVSIQHLSHFLLQVLWLHTMKFY